MHAVTDTPSYLPDPLAVIFDGEGYLVNPNHWSEDLARQLARDAGLPPLGDSHWQVIHYLRDYYHRYAVMPPARNVCRQLGIAGHNTRTMFGSCLTVWRIAGLPNPGEEVKAYTN